MDIQKAVEILLQVAEEHTYDSEYDGVCDTYCCFCHANLSRKKHDENCLTFLARDLVKDELAALKAQKEKEAFEAHKQTREYQFELTPCPTCTKMVKRIGMANHMRDSGCYV